MFSLICFIISEVYGLIKGYYLATEARKTKREVIYERESADIEEDADPYTDDVSAESQNQLHFQGFEMTGNFTVDFDLDLDWKRKRNDEITKFVCGCLNTGNANCWIIRLKNINHSNSRPKDYDDWIRGMEDKWKECFFTNIIDYIETCGDYNHEYIYVRVKPYRKLLSVKKYHYYPNKGSVPESSYEVLLRTMKNSSRPGEITRSVLRNYIIDSEPVGLDGGESESVQFKELNDSNVERTPKKISDYSSKYISAFANCKGGHIYFGIHDSSRIAKGVEVNAALKTSIEDTLDRRIKGMKWAANQEVKRGIHWDIEYCDIENSERKIIIISVCKFPGGVFTACPESYFIIEEKKLMKYDYMDWRSRMLQKHKDWNDVVIEYSENDRQNARNFLEFIKADEFISGYNIDLLDDVLIPGGNAILQRTKILDTTRLLVVFITDNLIHDGWANFTKDVNLAQSMKNPLKRNRIIPVLVDGAALPNELSTAERILYQTSGPNEGLVNGLKRAINKWRKELP